MINLMSLFVKQTRELSEIILIENSVNLDSSIQMKANMYKEDFTQRSILLVWQLVWHVWIITEFSACRTVCQRKL